MRAEARSRRDLVLAGKATEAARVAADGPAILEAKEDVAPAAQFRERLGKLGVEPG
jgi:hypothetical protein